MSRDEPLRIAAAAQLAWRPIEGAGLNHLRRRPRWIASSACSERSLSQASCCAIRSSRMRIDDRTGSPAVTRVLCPHREQTKTSRQRAGEADVAAIRAFDEGDHACALQTGLGFDPKHDRETGKPALM